MATQSQTRTRDDSGSSEGYRRIINDFGGSGSIQGTEDWPIDPEVADVKAIGLATLFGFAAIAALPEGQQVVGWGALAVLVTGAWVVVYLTPSDQTPLGWLAAIARFKRRPKRLTKHAERGEERTQSLTGIERTPDLRGRQAP